MRFFPPRLIPGLLLNLSLLAHAAGPVTIPMYPIKPIADRPADIPVECYPVPNVPQIDLLWLVRVQENLDKLKYGPYDLVFEGDSITGAWPFRAEEMWRARYGVIKTVDFAIGGNQVQHLLWTVQHGEIEGLNPKLIVLMIGTNNHEGTVANTAAGIKLLLNEYEARCPDAHILLLGVLPRGADPKDPLRDWVAKLNQLLASFDDGKRVTFLDAGAKFLQPDGSISSEILSDYLHPTAKGYTLLFDAIQPIIDKYFPPAPAPASKK